MEAGPDTSIGNLIGKCCHVGKAVGHARCSSARYCDLGNVLGSGRGLYDARDGAAEDAMRARIFRVHWRIVGRLPSCLAFREVIAVNITIPDGSDWAPEVVMVLGVEHSYERVVSVPVSASANVITDWDEKAVAVVMPMGSVGVSQQVYTAQRTMGMVHAAMFDAVNSIERRYQPYLVQLPADPATSKEAAAATAAAAVLATIDEKTAGEMKVTLASYLASVPDDGAAKADGIKLGEAVAAKVLEARANDGLVFGRRGEAFVAPLGPAIFDRNGLALDPTKFTQPPYEGIGP